MEIQTINLTMPVPRGMLFLYDSTAENVEIPSYTPEETVSYTKSAISIATTSDLDGETKITLTNSRHVNYSHLTKIFSNQIYLENGILNICVTGDEVISEISIGKNIVKLEVLSDGELFPDSILIIVSDLSKEPN